MNETDYQALVDQFAAITHKIIRDRDGAHRVRKQESANDPC